jgi:hypothetical protein
MVSDIAVPQHRTCDRPPHLNTSRHRRDIRTRRRRVPFLHREPTYRKACHLSKIAWQ